jgi:hypothetical protein
VSTLSPDPFDLLYGDLLVGKITGWSSGDGGMWSGTFTSTPEHCGTGLGGPRVLAFVEYSLDWQRRLELGKAEGNELSAFDDVTKSQRWAIRTSSGERRRIVDAPAFFPGGEVTWRESL